MAVYKMQQHSFVVLFVVVVAILAFSGVQGVNSKKIDLMSIGRNNMRKAAAIYNADKDAAKHIHIDDDDYDDDDDDDDNDDEESYTTPIPVTKSPQQKKLEAARKLKAARRRIWWAGR